MAQHIDEVLHLGQHVLHELAAIPGEDDVEDVGEGADDHDDGGGAVADPADGLAGAHEPAEPGIRELQGEAADHQVDEAGGQQAVLDPGARVMRTTVRLGSRREARSLAAQDQQVVRRPCRRSRSTIMQR